MLKLKHPAAATTENSKGRIIEEEESLTRPPFRRDLNRITHSTAFRRLKHKTQVFVYNEGDHYRTRLTHSLEVAQIARNIAINLGFNEDLTETLALAHDLGHTPFGHAGEKELNKSMAKFGGFEHNSQSLRIITKLEKKYALFDGLNLTWETIEGIIKHNGPLVDSSGNTTGKYKGKSLPTAMLEFPYLSEFQLTKQASVESQIAAIADEIAYNAHDIDDGLRSGLISIIDLGDIPIAGNALSEVLKRYPDLEKPRLIHETVRRIINSLVTDVITESQKYIKAYNPKSPDDIRAMSRPIICFSNSIASRNHSLKLFLRNSLYRHEKVLHTMNKARRIIRDLFDIFIDNHNYLPLEWQKNIDGYDKNNTARIICDFVAGMTDKYAIEKHHEFFDIEPIKY